MKIVSLVRILSGLLAFNIVSACTDDTGVTLHEPHVYKGKIDIHKYGSEYQEKRLQMRALLVFTDR